MAQDNRVAEQKRVFAFLLDKFKSRTPFTRNELENVAGYKQKSTFDTYWVKQFRPLIAPLGDDSYRVSQVFRRFNTWSKFQSHVTQTRNVITGYQPETVNSVMQFEFFMPLTNEGYLKSSLDELFYKDFIIGRLRYARKDDLQEFFKREADQSDAEYYERICNWISGVFGGYSISHVNGRFKAGDLKSTEEAAKSDRYLVDETTAIVRFIFPCTDGSISVKEQADRIRFFFTLLFVQNIVEVVSGEDEIWMIESGVNSALHIWRAQYD